MDLHATIRQLLRDKFGWRPINSTQAKELTALLMEAKFERKVIAEAANCDNFPLRCWLGYTNDVYSGYGWVGQHMTSWYNLYLTEETSTPPSAPTKVWCRSTTSIDEARRVYLPLHPKVSTWVNLIPRQHCLLSEWTNNIQSFSIRRVQLGEIPTLIPLDPDLSWDVQMERHQFDCAKDEILIHNVSDSPPTSLMTRCRVKTKTE